ncbi:hypothetical protein [Ekhidna sp.]|uniref:hypothetical protein n=1 Tax=Ekhidna sp. TaxID=2608089 RepID=UPI00329927B9
MFRIFILSLPLVICGYILSLINPFSINEQLLMISMYFHFSMFIAIVISIIAINERLIKKLTDKGFNLVTSRFTRVIGIIVLSSVISLLLTSVVLATVIDQILIYISLFILLGFVPPAWLLFEKQLVLYNDKKIVIANLDSILEINKSDVIKVSKEIFRGYRITFRIKGKSFSKFFYVKPDDTLKRYSSDLPIVINDMLD